MKITDCSNNTKIIDGLDTLLIILETATFADECRYEIRSYGRHFYCKFVTNGLYSEECFWHVKYLKELANDISILENKSKIIRTRNND